MELYPTIDDNEEEVYPDFVIKFSVIVAIAVTIIVSMNLVELLDKYETANDSQCVDILKQSILDAIENYKNKNIPQQYIDVIVEKMKASINEWIR